MAALFGDRVRLLRRARGLGIRDVAAAVGLSPVALSRIERGAIEPDEQAIRTLAAYFEEDQEELLLLAGRFPPDLLAILQRHPAESVLLLRQHFSAGKAKGPLPGRPSFVPTALVTAVTDWAIRSASDVVLDPSSGDGTLLAAAANRLLTLGAQPAEVLKQLHGYDGDTEACARAVRHLQEVTGGTSRLIRREGFLRTQPRSRLPFEHTAPPMVTALVGMIPSTGKAATAAERRQARAVAIEAGIDLPEGVSVWAALIVHAASFVQTGGRLGLIVPAAILHAHYAAGTRSYLAQLFPALTVVTFARPLPGIGEAVVVLGDSRGEPGVRSIRVADSSQLAAALVAEHASGTEVAEARPLRWSGASLPTPGLALLGSLRREGVLRRLGDLVQIDVGVVTGANRFFVVDGATSNRLNPAFLRRMLASARVAPGLIFHQGDWKTARDAGESCFLLCIPPGAEIDAATRRYLKTGEREGIPQRVTCRRRPLWYVLPEARSPAAFLTYLCPRLPRMLVNEAEAVHANMLHSVQPRPGVDVATIAAAFASSASLLGCELLGRHYGGGVLKLEPAEVENLLIPYPASAEPASVRALLQDADRIWREGRPDDAVALIDQALVCKQLGVEERVVAELRRHYESERDRRCAR